MHTRLLLITLITIILSSSCSQSVESKRQDEKNAPEILKFHLSSIDLNGSFNPPENLDALVAKDNPGFEGEIEIILQPGSEPNQFEAQVVALVIAIDSFPEIEKPTFQDMLIYGEADVPGKLTSFNLQKGKGKFEIQVEVSTPIILRELSAPIIATAVIDIVDSTPGVMSQAGALWTNIEFIPVTDLRNSSFSTIFKQQRYQTQYTEKWPRLRRGKLRHFRNMIRAGLGKKEILKMMVKCLKLAGVDFSNVKEGSPEYRPGDGTGITNERGRIIIQDGAFASAGLLYSTLMHEIKHANQFKHRPTMKKPAREIEAWLQECENLRVTGLHRSRRQKDRIRLGLREEYGQIGFQDRIKYGPRVVKCMLATR